MDEQLGSSNVQHGNHLYVFNQVPSFVRRSLQKTHMCIEAPLRALFSPFVFKGGEIQSQRGKSRMKEGKCKQIWRRRESRKWGRKARRRITLCESNRPVDNPLQGLSANANMTSLDILSFRLRVIQFSFCLTMNMPTWGVHRPSRHWFTYAANLKYYPVVSNLSNIQLGAINDMLQSLPVVSYRCFYPCSSLGG